MIGFVSRKCAYSRGRSPQPCQMAVRQDSVFPNPQARWLITFTSLFIPSEAPLETLAGSRPGFQRGAPGRDGRSGGKVRAEGGREEGRPRSVEKSRASGCPGWELSVPVRVEYFRIFFDSRNFTKETLVPW